MADDMSLSSSVAVVSEQHPEKGYLAKRKDFLGKDEYADSHPNRTYYFKRNQDLNEVIETCTRKLYEDPNNMRALYLRGSSFFKKNYLDACIQDLSTVLRSQPTHQDCLYTRGLAYFKTNKHELALKDLTRVLELNPDHVNAAYSRAACYNKMGLLTEAIEDYNFALSKDQSSNGSVTSGNTSSNLMPPSTPLFPSSSSKDDLASFGGMNSSASSIAGGNNGGTDTPKSIGTMSLSSYLHKSGRVETPRTASSAGMWSGENSPSRSNIVPAGSGNKKLDAIDAAGIFSLYEEGYESSTSGTGTQRSQSRGRSRVDSNDGSYIDSAPASTIGTRRPSFSSTSTGSTLNPSSTVNGNNNGRSTTPGGGNGFSFKSLSEMKRPTNGAQQNSGNGQLQPGGQNTAPSTPMRTPIGVASAQFQGSETNGGNGFLPPPSRSRSGSIGRNNTLSNVSAASLDSNNGMNSNGNSMYNFNANPLFPPPGSQVPSSSSSSAQQQQGRPIVSDYDQQAADQFHAEAFELRKKGNFPGAIEEYSKALKFHPTHFKSLFNRGFAYDKVGQFDLAIQDYSAAIEIEPNYPLCYYNRGITYDHMNQSQRAFDDFSTAITLYEEKMQQQQGQQGQPDTSLITQSYIDFYQNRAFCGKKMSLLEQAIKDFSSVVSLTEQVLSSVQQPSLVNVMHNYLYKAYFHRSLCQERLSNYQEAIQDVSKAMQEIQILHSNNSSSSSPNQPLPLAAIGTMVNCLTTRANLWEVTQQDDLAFQDYSIALKHLLSSSSAVTSSGQMQPLIANQLFTVYTARGKLHAKQEIFDMAIEDYSSILNMIPRNAPPPNNGPGNGSNAALWWTIRDNLIETYQARGLCFKTLQDYSAALQDYQQIIRLTVNNNHNGPVVPIENTITIFQEIANCHKKLENYEAAIEAYSKLLDLSPKNIKAYNSRAFLFAKLGRFKEAVQDYSTVIHIDPTNSHAFHNRGISYDKMGLIDLAITDFGKVFELDAKQSMTSMNAADPAATAAVDRVVAMMRPVPAPMPGPGPGPMLNNQGFGHGPPPGQMQMQGQSQQSYGPPPLVNSALPSAPIVASRGSVVRPPSVVPSSSVPNNGGNYPPVNRGTSISPTPSHNSENGSMISGATPPPSAIRMPTPLSSANSANPYFNTGSAESSSAKLRSPPKSLPPHPSMMNNNNSNTNSSTPSSSISSLVPPPLSSISNGGGRVLMPQIRPSALVDREKDKEMGNNSPPSSSGSASVVLAPASNGISASALLQPQGGNARSKTPLAFRGRVVENNPDNAPVNTPVPTPAAASSVAPPITALRPQTSFIRQPSVVTPQPSPSVTFAPDTIDRSSSSNNGGSSANAGLMNAASFLANLRGDSNSSAQVSIPMGRFGQR